MKPDLIIEFAGPPGTINPDTLAYLDSLRDDVEGYAQAASEAEARARVASRGRGAPMTGAYDPAVSVTFENGREAPVMDRRGQSLMLPVRGNFGGADYAAGEQAVYYHEDRDETAYIFVHHGQSNAQGMMTLAAALVGATPIYPDNALMLSGGVRRTAGVRGTSLVPLVEQSDGPLKSTAMSGWVNHFIRDHAAALGFKPTVVGFVPAIGGLPYMGLMRGTAAYRAFTEGLEDAVKLLRERGYWRIVVVFAWTQGEHETSSVTNMTEGRYLAQLKNLYRTMSADVRARTGATDNPVMLINQTALTVGSDPWTMPVRQAQVAIDGWDAIRLAGPIYCYPHIAEDLDLHMASQGQIRCGQQMARATLEEVLGAGWRGVKPLEASFISATQFAIDFDAQNAPLVLDASGSIIATAGNANHGFRFQDGSGSPPAITGVAVSGLSVIITLASAPTGPRPQLGYAIERNAGSPDGGPVNGARGTLRDSTAHVSLYGDSPQANWCPAFILDIQGRAA